MSISRRGSAYLVSLSALDFTFKIIEEIEWLNRRYLPSTFARRECGRLADRSFPEVVAIAVAAQPDLRIPVR
jgi:hypothetical protein